MKKLEDIEFFVCDEYEVSVLDLKSKSRIRPLPEARHVYFYLAKKYTKKTARQITCRLNRDRSLVPFVYNKNQPNSIVSKILFDGDLRTKIDAIERMIVERK